MKWNTFKKRLTASLAHIHLVDKCLLLFLTVLLLQSAFTLFTKNTDNTEVEHIDVIVRTSTAAIFGYILSVNFIRRSEKEEEEQELVTKQALEPDQTEPEALPSETEVTGRIQILVATGIGLFCLLTLISLRNFNIGKTILEGSATATATMAQFRDFVSGCVGFLIGCPSDFTRKRQ